MIGLTTARERKVYLHILRWPGREACIAGIKNKVLSASLLATDQRVEVEQRGERTFFRGLPRYPPDPYDSVLALELDGKPEAI